MSDFISEIFYDSPVVLQEKHPPKAVVIWLHGLGADGHNFVSIVEEMGKFNLDLSGIKFIFPHAPYRSITLNRGAVMRGWYDIDNLSASREDEKGVRESARYLRTLIETEHQAGTPYEKIILAGFSQGGAVALYTGLTLPFSLGGILALSTYLPIASSLKKEWTKESQPTPIFMIHGTHDSIISLSIAESSRASLEQGGYAVEFLTYPMDHTVCDEEVKEITEFLSKVISN